jgi:cytochrome c-type biogenesis protein CcmF
MSGIEYANEHIWIHYTGHFLLLTAFLSALYAVFAHVLSIRSHALNWKDAVRVAFWVHLASIYLAIALLLFILYKKYFAYEYVWAHASADLPLRYILAAFWEGQEGSFLLWLFWNGAFGIYFVRQTRPIRLTVLVVLLGVNALLTSMLLGIHLGDFKIGSSPFLLLRHSMDLPLFNNADYARLIEGNGLNPLLQNYWMTIHPPVLFLGFASTLAPFAYACAALIHQDWKAFIKESLPWAAGSAFALGAGILMGAAWAYEALSFGGYWAWDPVENMSLAPWLILLAGLHTNLVSRASGHSIRATLWLYALSFVFVCYSSYLTRSGVLGDSSAHAFTEMGLEGQLVLLCLVACLLPIILFIRFGRGIPSLPEEESIRSREFWMYIGSLVLLFSALLMTFTTSIPVYNKMLDLVGSLSGNDLSNLRRSMPLDPVAHHNQFQLWTALFMAMLSGASTFLRYRSGQSKGDVNGFFKLLTTSLVLSVLAAWLLKWLAFPELHWSHLLLLWSSFFSVASALLFLATARGLLLRKSAVAISHAGFGILLLGIVFTGVNKRYLSTNQFAQEGLWNEGEGEDLSKYLTLIRQEPMYMKDYWVEYTSDTFVHTIRHYALKFWKEDSSGLRTDSFTLHPQIQYDNKVSKVAAANPSIRRKVEGDLFALVAQIPQSQVDIESAQRAEDSLRYRRVWLAQEDSVATDLASYQLVRQHHNLPVTDFERKPGDQVISADLLVKRHDDSRLFRTTSSILFRDELVYRFPARIDAMGVRIQIPDTAIEAKLPAFKDVNWSDIQMHIGDSIVLPNGMQLQLLNVHREGADSTHSSESKKAFQVIADIQLQSGQEHFPLKPRFVLRGNQVISPPASCIHPGFSIRFVRIDPATERMHFEYALFDLSSDQVAIPLDIAENGPRTDFIVIQVITFPWISLVWLGAIMMVAGLLVSSFVNRNALGHAA